MLTAKKILIVEDCRDLLNLQGDMLALMGWDTILADSGETMSKLEQDLPCVVLLNLRTPVMNGVKVAATLKAHPGYKNIPILAASGLSNGLTRERCLALGCDDFIAKPLALAELETHLTNLFFAERRKAIRATAPIQCGNSSAATKVEQCQP